MTIIIPQTNTRQGCECFGPSKRGTFPWDVVRALPLRVTGHDPEPYVRSMAVQLAAVFDAQRTEVKQRVREALNDPDVSVVSTAVAVLADMDPQLPELPAALRRLVKDMSVPRDTRADAAEHLARIAPDTEGLLQVLEEFLPPLPAQLADGTNRGRFAGFSDSICDAYRHWVDPC